MAYNLTGCKTTLIQGRYSWCHDKVLTVLTDILEQERTKKPNIKLPPVMAFAKEGAKSAGPHGPGPSLLQSAQAGELRVYLKRRLRFSDVIHTTIRPDAVLFSMVGEKFIQVELTVPWEGCEEVFGEEV